MLTLDIFGFKALWSPYFFTSIALFTALYFILTIKYRSKFEGSEPLRPRQIAFFVTSMVLLYIVKGSPLDLLGHITFYAHMIQMGSLYLIVVPLFIMGIPPWLWRAVIKIPLINKIFAFMTKPLIALVVFNGMFSLYHVPFIFDAVKQSLIIHALFTAGIFIFALFMWWPIVTELPEHQTLTGLKKLGYIFADGILITPACALIIFTNTPLYAAYSDPALWAKSMELCVSPSLLAGLDLSGPEMFSTLSLIEDQRLGGVVMKMIQEIVYAVFLAKVFFEWYRQEHSGIDPEPEPLAAE
ncbi:cytochrome c oxidase assembly factor CtaG [Neobacillus notoginsengisoli]|uniref:Cytochrome c oxidase assembly factor CtaG n=1 Tax=Neobacillus notoginsengisoli TaxID=1578198 RepID=A0A417YR56_9BACI|nr:cytochrome c oxidase assembly factor CtaG [Neobacillus notoginsengisoli]RHW36535.1 cytochrome c oxidase assembly factor CtaG [Neobacillus notoginsengisoli]